MRPAVLALLASACLTPTGFEEDYREQYCARVTECNAALHCDADDEPYADRCDFDRDRARLCLTALDDLACGPEEASFAPEVPEDCLYAFVDCE